MTYRCDARSADPSHPHASFGSARRPRPNAAAVTRVSTKAVRGLSPSGTKTAPSMICQSHSGGAPLPDIDQRVKRSTACWIVIRMHQRPSARPPRRGRVMDLCSDAAVNGLVTTRDLLLFADLSLPCAVRATSGLPATSGMWTGRLGFSSQSRSRASTGRTLRRSAVSPRTTAAGQVASRWHTRG